MKYTSIEFDVRGAYTFPTDMLRYDSCYPVTSEDVSKIDAANRHEQGSFSVRLRSHQESVIRHGPTARRWQSFGWSVIENTMTLYKDGVPYPMHYRVSK